MGANAQTSVPLFVANTVLTAAQQNISAATGVPVFATTATRDAAFGGSNKALAEGQTCYIEAAPNRLMVYDGAAWRPVDLDTWTSYTPVVTSLSGTITTASATGAFATVGKIVFVRFTGTITTNGTGATGVLITLPSAFSTNYAENTAIGVAREKGVTGNLLQACTQGTASIVLFTYVNGYPGANGAVLAGSCSYEQSA